MAVRVQRALSLPTKKEAEHVVNAVIRAGDDPAQSSGRRWIHTEAQQLWQISCASQAGDLPEGWIHWRNHSDENEAEDQVHQFGGAAATGTG